MEIVFYLRTLNQVLGAGIAITALSLFLRALSFSLADRVSRGFALMLFSLMIIFSGEAISNAIVGESIIRGWIKFHWIGLVFFPASITYFGDALLETTGRPSRGRRRKVINLAYFLSWGYLVLILTDVMLGKSIVSVGGYVYPSPTPFSISFSIYYLLAMLASGIWIYRAYQRTRLNVSKKRMRTLFIAVIFMAIGAYPYLQIGAGAAGNFPVWFGAIVVIGNIPIFSFLISMAYAIGFFGVPWPDRIIKSRLLKWLLRGPLTVFIVLALMTGIHEVGQFYGTPYTVAIPIVTTISVLIIEHLITLVYPSLERWFFHGGEQENVKLLQSLAERMVTRQDLEQFMEVIVAAICDKFEVSSGFVASIGDAGINQIVQVGKSIDLIGDDAEKSLVENVSSQFEKPGVNIFSWNEFWIYPLFNQDKTAILGIMGVMKRKDHILEEGLVETFAKMGDKAAIALEDRKLQKQIFDAIEALQPKVDLIQQLRAASRYDQKEIFDNLDSVPKEKDIAQWVRDALTHYWGGPKLTDSPLMNFRVVKYAVNEHEGNPVNALRGILKKAVEQVRPEGERRFTADWILYNILELKFLEGRKVREVALRLAMSEADLYRKQRVAIEAVAEAVMAMENQIEE